VRFILEIHPESPDSYKYVASLLSADGQIELGVGAAYSPTGTLFAAITDAFPTVDHDRNLGDELRS
jgi:hypothetical protein